MADSTLKLLSTVEKFDGTNGRAGLSATAALMFINALDIAEGTNHSHSP